MEQVSTILAGQCWIPGRLDGPQTIRLDGGRIASISPGIPTCSDKPLDARDALVVPGLVDIQNNGGLGWSFQATDCAHFDEICAYYLSRGTTTLLPTLVTAHPSILSESLAVLAHWCAGLKAPTLAGIHLEGPFLSPEKSGAHDPQYLRLPDMDLMKSFLAASSGWLRMVSLAPELPGALELIHHLVQEGVLICAAHSTASYAQVQEAVHAGLRFMTHLGNASDWPHRRMNQLGFLGSEPGFVGSFLAMPELGGSVIMDGFHFHPALLRPIIQLKGVEKIVLVSDASSACGLPPGDYSSGGLNAMVHSQGFATSSRGGGWLAGSIITLLDAVQRAVRLAGLPFEQALTMATQIPAQWVGLEGQKGQIIPGADADLLVLNQNLRLRQVIAAGRLVYSN